MAERLAVFRDRYDTFRSAVVNEPRGSDVMVGAILLPPVDPACAAGVIFFNNVGYLGMCGHGTIGVAVALAYLGRIGPGSHRLETPVGPVTITLEGPNTVAIDNVESYRLAKDVSVTVPGLEDLRGRRRLGRQLVFPRARSWRGPERGQRRAADRGDLADSPGARRGRNHRRGGARDRPHRAVRASDCARCRQQELRALPRQGLRPLALRHRHQRQARVLDAPTASSARARSGGKRASSAACSRDRCALSDGRVRPRIRGTAYVNAESTLIVDPADPLAMGIRP